MNITQKRRMRYWVRNNLMFYLIIGILMGIIILLVTFIMLKGMENTKTYSENICQMYGLNKECK